MSLNIVQKKLNLNLFIFYMLKSFSQLNILTNTEGTLVQSTLFGDLVSHCLLRSRLQQWRCQAQQMYVA